MRARFSRGLWRHPDFLRLWAGTSISLMGTGLGAVPFTALLYLRASASEMAFLGVAQVAPGLAGGLLAGAWVDRVRRRPLLIAADLARAALLLSLPAAAIVGTLTMAQLYAVAVLLGGCEIVFDVAYQSYLPTLVAREDLVEANSRLAASQSVAETGAFSIGGWIAQLTSALVAATADALSFLGSALFLWSIRAPEPAPGAREGGVGFLREALGGFATLPRDGRLLGIAGNVVGTRLARGLIGAVILIYGNRELGLPAGVLGMIFAVGGVTSLAGTFVADAAARRLGLGRSLVVAGVVTSLTTLLLPLARGPAALATAFLIAGQVFDDPAEAVLEINRTTLQQAVTPHNVRGRVNAAFRLLELAAMLVGALAAAWLAPAAGLRAVLVAGMACRALGAASLALSPARRELSAAGALPAGEPA